MPNWAYTNVTVKGTVKSVRKVISLGLVNSGISQENIPSDIHEAFDLLLKEGKHKVALYEDAPEKKGWEKSVIGVQLGEGVTMRTFVPTPDHYILYDTTNQPNSAPEWVLEEQQKLGAIGWYDYNRLTLGTKWDADLEGLDLMVYDDCEDGEARITFRTETAWSLPDGFFRRLSEIDSELLVICEGTEESNAYFTIVVFQDGSGWEYDDLTEEFNDAIDKWQEQRNALEAEGKSEEEIDEELGEWYDSDNFGFKLDEAYEKAVEELTVETLNKKISEEKSEE